MQDSIVIGSVWVCLGGGNEVKTNHLLYMDDLKLHVKSYDQIERLIETAHAVRKHIGIEFGIKRCRILLLRSGKVVIAGVSLPDWQVLTEINDNGAIWSIIWSIRG